MFKKNQEIYGNNKWDGTTLLILFLLRLSIKLLFISKQKSVYLEKQKIRILFGTVSQHQSQ